MAKNLGLEFYRVYDEQKNILRLHNSWSTFSKMVPSVYNPPMLLDLNNLQCTLDNMSKEIPPEAMWKARKAFD